MVAPPASVSAEPRPCGDSEPELPSAAFATLFPSDDDDRWSGFRYLFDERDYPDFGADLAGGRSADGTAWEAIISAEASFDQTAVARLIQRRCQHSLGTAPIGFEWSVTCSRQRIDEFGGVWCAVFPDRIEIESTWKALAAALASGTS